MASTSRLLEYESDPEEVMVLSEPLETWTKRPRGDGSSKSDDSGHQLGSCLGSKRKSPSYWTIKKRQFNEDCSDILLKNMQLQISQLEYKLKFYETLEQNWANFEAYESLKEELAHFKKEWAERGETIEAYQRVLGGIAFRKIEATEKLEAEVADLKHKLNLD